ncbi:efflux RND transporter periplasmic adaptor subunit [Niabella aquatica]
MKKLIIYILVVMLIAACGNKPSSEEKRPPAIGKNTVVLTDAQYKNAGIETAKLNTRSIAAVLKVNGKIEVPPQNRVSVSVPLGGYLQSTRLMPGMYISKGQVLAVMEDPQYIQLQQDYLTAKAQFAFNESEYRRQKELNESKAASDKVYEQARATYHTQIILIRSLEEKLKLIGLNPGRVTAGNISKSIPVYSPISGYVAAVLVNRGKYVNPSDVLFELVNTSDIHLALTVFEKDINKLATGQKLLAYTNNNPSKKYTCTIMLISKNLASDNAAEVHCHFENYDKNLLPGTFMNADIEYSGSTAMALPDEAIVRFENKQYAFVLKDKNRFQMQEVQTGVSESGFTGLLNADALAQHTFVTKGAYTLLMALKNAGEE